MPISPIALLVDAAAKKQRLYHQRCVGWDGFDTPTCPSLRQRPGTFLARQHITRVSAMLLAVLARKKAVLAKDQIATFYDHGARYSALLTSHFAADLTSGSAPKPGPSGKGKRPS